MLKSCKYCGRIHDSKYVCSQKAKTMNDRRAKYKDSDKDRFRNSKAWKNKRDEIRELDKELCSVCRDRGRYVYDGLSVHHVESLEDAWDKRLDNDNLITLCSRCHEDAENGAIDREYLIGLIVERDKDNGNDKLNRRISIHGRHEL